MRTIGIDVGINGAIAVLDNNFNCVYPMPTIRLPAVNKTKRKTVVDAVRLADLLRTLTNGADEVLVAIEEVHAMPNQGVTSMFSFGRSYGIIIGVCATLGIKFVFVRPQKWKSGYKELEGLKGDEAKNMARDLATRLYPNLKVLFEKRKDDGKAEAILIANYHSVASV